MGTKRERQRGVEAAKLLKGAWRVRGPGISRYRPDGQEDETGVAGHSAPPFWG